MAVPAFLTDVTVPLLWLEPKLLTSSFAKTHGLSCRGLKRCQQQLLSMIPEDKTCISLLSHFPSSAKDGHTGNVLVKEEVGFENKHEPSIKEEPLHWDEAEFGEGAKVFGEIEGVSDPSAEKLSACSSVKEGSFPCNHCKYSVSQKNKFTSHLLIGGSVRDNLFVCKYCGFRTDYPGNLKTHLLIHESDGGELFACHHCRYRTGSKDRLKMHLLMHDVARNIPYACNYCLYRTESERSLKNASTTAYDVLLCRSDCVHNLKVHRSMHESDRNKVS